MLSDKLSLLSEKQLDMLSKLFPLNEDAALPLDLMEADIPGVLDLGTKGKIRTVMLVNWENGPKVMGVHVGNVHVFDFWSGTYEGTVETTYAAEIAPHCCKVLFLTPVGEPAVIGTDGVIVPDLTQSYADGVLTTGFLKASEIQFVAAEELMGEGCGIQRIQDGLYKLTQQGEVFTVTLRAR